ncbi:MAG: helix-turn-helix domain-containing protein [Lysinibacillus sp.]
MNRGARGKYAEWLTEEGLLKLESWARTGLTDDQIARNMGISRSTLSEYKKKYSDISDALKRGKEVVDILVENALLKRALGYQYIEKKSSPVEMSDEEHHALKKYSVQRFKLENPAATMEEIRAYELSISKYKMVVVEEKTKEVAPDVTAQIFWLKNRKSGEWRDKQQTEVTGADGEPLQVLFNIPRPPSITKKGKE